jgi:MHS family proline/betaine transporter-like MFS transporter
MPITRAQLAGAIGNAVEWFDFAIYGYFARVIGSQFFPNDSASLQLLSAFGLFAVGYLMRPIGSLVLGPVGDFIGRRALLLISVAVMSLCSLAIALLPTTAQWGMAAAWCLVALRMLQGLSVGGEFTGSVVALVEGAPASRRGLHASFSAAGASLGFVAGSLAAALVNLLLSPDAVLRWGWRIPFLLGAALGLWALSLRRDMIETRPDQPTPTLQGHAAAIGAQIPMMLRLMGASALGSVSLASITVFQVEALSSLRPQFATQYVTINTVNQAIGVGLILLGGALSDRFSAPLMARRTNLAIAVLVVPAMLLSSSGLPMAFAVGQLALLVPLMLYSGIYPSLFPYLFPATSRCSAFSLSHSLVSALVGGTTPLVATWLFEGRQLLQGPAFYCLLWAIPTLLALRGLERHTRAAEDVS